MYVFVDKRLTPSQQVVQASHACIEASRRMLDIIPHPHLVVIGLKNANKLASIATELEEKVKIFRFYEGEQFTAFATQPVVEEQRSIFERFTLL